LQKKLADGKPLVVGNLFEGNRIRKSKTIIVNSNKKIRKEKSGFKNFVVRFFTWWLY
jgi:hypothetical protein